LTDGKELIWAGEVLQSLPILLIAPCGVQAGTLGTIGPEAIAVAINR